MELIAILIIVLWLILVALCIFVKQKHDILNINIDECYNKIEEYHNKLEELNNLSKGILDCVCNIEKHNLEELEKLNNLSNKADTHNAALIKLTEVIGTLNSSLEKLSSPKTRKVKGTSKTE